MSFNGYRILNLEETVIAYFIIYYILPKVSYFTNPIIPLVISLVYLFLISINDKIIAKKFFILLCLVLFISMLYFLLTDTQTINKNVDYYNIKRFYSKFNQIYFSFFPSILSYRVFKCSSFINKKKIVLFSIFLIVFVLYNSISKLLIDPDLVRNWDNFNKLSSINVGSYTFVYSISVISVLTTLFIINVKSINIKVVSIIFYLICIFYLILAQYTLSILISIIGTFLIIFRIYKNKYQIMLILFFLFFLPFIPYAIKLILPYINSRDIHNRLYEIISFLNGNGLGFNMLGRLSLYIRSIQSFIHSPIIGNRYLGFDGHSTFLTILSDLGIMGAVPYFYLFIVNKKQNSKLLQDYGVYFNSIFSVYLLIGLTNPIHSAFNLSFSVWFLVPVFISYLKEGLEDKKYAR